MVNLFQYIEDISDDELRLQIAMLREVTLKNAAMPLGQKTARATVKAARGIAGFFGKKLEIAEPEVVTVEEKIKAEYEAIQMLPRPSLEYHLREELKKRLGFFTKTLDDEALSKAIVLEAAKHFDHIGADLTIAQKADGVARAYHDRIRENTQKALKKQSTAEAADTVRRMDESIRQMTAEERRQVKDALKIEELTGKTMRNAVLTAGLPAAALTMTSGMGVFVATTTIMHAVFTTALGITLPFAAYSGTMSVLGFLTGPVGWILVGGFTAYQLVSGTNKIDREMLAQFVYIIFLRRKRPFAPLEEELRSWRTYTDGQDMEEALRAQIAKFEEERRSFVSKADMARQNTALEEFFQAEMERRERALKEEAEQKIRAIREQANLSLAEKEREIQKTNEQMNEIMEKLNREHKKEMEKQKRAYEKMIEEKNREIETMRAGQDDLIRRLEQNQSNHMLRNEEITEEIKRAVTQARREIDIISPWVEEKVVKRYLQDFHDAIRRGVVVKILYGMGKAGEGRNIDTDQTVEDLKKEFSYTKKMSIRRGNEHSKLIICDDAFYIITSFNPLSFGGKFNANTRGEIGECSENVKNLQAYRNQYFGRF